MSQANRRTALNTIWRKVIGHRLARPALLMLFVLVIAGALIAGRNFLKTEKNQSQNAANEQSTETDLTAPTGSASDLDPATAWDSTASEINAFRQDLAPLATRYEQLWDDRPNHEQPHNEQE